MTKILLVEDDKAIVSNLTEFLNNEGYIVKSVSGQTAAMKLLAEEKVDLVLLDVSLAEGNGSATCKAIKAEYDIPVIFLTASGDEFSTVTGFDLGADDYIVKPISIMEMVSRVKAVLRRSQPHQVSKLLKTGGLVVNMDEHTVIADGDRIQLTYKEFELLCLFLSHPGIVYTREQLFSHVWKQDYMGDSRTLDSHIRSLRQKLNGYGKMIETVRNVGYRWEAQYDK